MPRKLDETMRIEEIEDEICYSEARVQAHPATKHLQERVAGWYDIAEEMRNGDRESRRATIVAQAIKDQAGETVDQACVDFSEDLDHAVRGDHKGTRWRRFFSVAVSRFTRLPILEQIRRMKEWFTVTGDDILETHRPALTGAVAGIESAELQKSSARQHRLTTKESRRTAAARLTSERDSLHRSISELAAQQSLPRDFADGFFLRTRRDTADAPEAPEAPTA